MRAKVAAAGSTTSTAAEYRGASRWPPPPPLPLPPPPVPPPPLPPVSPVPRGRSFRSCCEASTGAGAGPAAEPAAGPGAGP